MVVLESTRQRHRDNHGRFSSMFSRVLGEEERSCCIFALGS